MGYPLKENEWIEIKGLMSRSSNEIKNGEIMHQNDEACVCIIERTNPLDQTNIFAAQTCCWSILENCVQAELDAESSNQRSKLSTMPSFSDEENNSVASSFSGMFLFTLSSITYQTIFNSAMGSPIKYPKNFSRNIGS